MASKKIISRFVWIIVFHATTSLFYLCMLMTFMYTKNLILTGRMITTWYLMFHIGFIFLRLIQDFINLTPIKSCKFNENFTKFNNLVFISIIFPFALYLPLLYWLLFLYDSNLMLPNFVEISLPTWVSTSSHSVIAVVALVEMTTTEYTYEGNHITSFIIMSIFSAGYVICLIETYVQYGFWLYPVFHLLPASYLPVAFLMLIALLLLVYFIGKIIAKRFLATEKSDGKFVEDNSNELSPIVNDDSNASQESQDKSSNCRRKLQSTSTEEQQTVSSLILIKQVLEKIVLSPLRSNIQKMSRDEEHFFKVDDETKSSSYLAAKEDCKIPLGGLIKPEELDYKCKMEDDENIVKQKVGKRYCYCFEAMENDHEFISHVTILKNISTNQNDNNQLNSSNLFQESQNFNYNKESSNCKVDDDDAYDVYETADEMDPCHKNDEKSLPLKSVAEKNSNTDEHAVPSDAVSYPTPTEREGRNKTRDKLFRFRLQLFSHHNCIEKLAPKELHRERKKSAEKISGEDVLYSKMKKHKQSTFLKKGDSVKESETDSVKFTTDSENDTQTVDHDSGKPLLEDCIENSHYASINFEKSKIKVIPNIYETCKRSSKPKFGFHKRSKEMTPSSTNNPNSTSSGKKVLDVAPTPGTSSGIHISNPLSKNNDSNAVEQCLSIYSTTESKSGEKNKKKRKNKQGESSIEMHKPRKMENKLKSIINDLHDWKQEKHDQKIHDDVDVKETNVKDESENKTTTGVKFNTMKLFKLNLSKREKGNNEKINDDDVMKCQCNQNSGKGKPQSKTKREKYFIRMFSDSNDKKKKPKKINEIRGSESTCSFSTSALDKSQNQDHTHSVSRTRKEQSAGSNQKEKTLEKRNEEIGNLQDEKSRYEKLPKLNCTCLKKINVASCLCSSETQCKKKRTTGKENCVNESSEDLPEAQEYLSKCSNQSGDNTKKKFIARFFKFSKRTSKGDEEKKLAEIFKKCSNGSKIGAIFATIPDKNEIHLNVDLENANVLQDLRTSLSSNGGKQFKFCIFLS